jgi:hypothetical protein
LDAELENTEHVVPIRGDADELQKRIDRLRGFADHVCLVDATPVPKYPLTLWLEDSGSCALLHGGVTNPQYSVAERGVKSTRADLLLCRRKFLWNFSSNC